MSCSRAQVSSIKQPSAPESIKALQEADEPVQRRWTDKVVQDLEGETGVVALTSSPPLTDELWLLLDMK
jgi:hypothetical protein